MRKLLILSLSLSFLFACDDKNDCEGFTLGEEFEIAVNETIENCPKNISATLLDIQDSRCPMGGVCVWEGMIVIESRFRIDGDEFDVKLSNNERVSGFSEVFSTEDYTLKLIDVLPYPDTSKLDQASKQRVILVISKRTS